MPRNFAGNYTLPAGNPVVAGTTIDASWANDTMSDLANEITNSLSRNGEGGMLAAFRVADGTVSAPGLAFTNETNSGIYRAGTGELWLAVGGVAVAQITGNGLLIPSGKRIALPAPVNDTDAANKVYVDDLVEPVIGYADFYLGPKSSDPTLNNSGGALTAGTTYWSTTLSQMRVYNGTIWEPMPSTASLQGQTFSGTGAQTAFTLAAPTGNATNLEVFISGVRQVPTNDYTVSGTTLTFVAAPPSGTNNIYVRFAQLIALASADSSNVSFLQSGTGASSRTVQSKLRDVVSVKDFGAVGDGVANDTAAIQAAITAAGVGKEVIWPAGTYKVTSTLSMPHSGQKWVGAGSKATIIQFAPTAADTCVQFGEGASECVRAGISGIGFYSADSTYAKVALDVAYCSEFEANDIAVSGGVVGTGGTLFWSGASSVGIRTRGHEACRFYGITVAADIPLQISQGYNRAAYMNLDIDHFNFHDLYLLANGNPCVLIDTGVNVTNVSFTGFQAWVLGTAGLQWVDTTTTVTASNITIDNLRTEQGISATAYSIDIQHNSNIYSLRVSNANLDPTRRGIRLRKCRNVNLEQIAYGGSLETLNVDSTVAGLGLNNCYWQAGSTASITGQRIVWSAPNNPSTAPLPPTAYYDEAASTKRNEIHDGVISATAVTVANNGTASLGPSGVTSIIMISNSIGVNAIFMLNGTNNSVYEVSDPAGQFSITAGTATSTNIYWSAANSRYEIQNTMGSSMKYAIVYLGSYGVVA